MAEPEKYLLDTNILVEAHKRYYGFDLCPGFWKAVVRQHHASRIFSIDRVKTEIAQGKDKLTKWTRKVAPKTFFRKTDSSAIIERFKGMVAWVQDESQFKPEAKAEFLTVADGWLIAYATSRRTDRRNRRSVQPRRQEESTDSQRVPPIPSGNYQYF